MFSVSVGYLHTSQSKMLVLQFLHSSLETEAIITEEDLGYLFLHLPPLTLLLPTLNHSISIRVMIGWLHLVAS